MANKANFGTRVLAMSAAAAFVQSVSPVAIMSHAQTDTSADEERSLDRIVVTATKRETTLEDTPITVSVIDGDTLEDRQLVEITELFSVVPGVTFNQSPADLPAISIRGIGTLGGNQTFEQSVGLFLDGVYKPRARQYRDSLFDIERIEAIKGAQGVVFGKNTSVGAISVITRKPGDSFGGSVNASYETEFDSYAISAAADLPASDVLKFRVGGQYLDTGGYIENTTLGTDVPSTERWTLRGTGEFDPDGPLSARLMLQSASLERVGNGFELTELYADPGSQFLQGLFQITDAGDFVTTTDGSVTFPDGSVFPIEGDEQDTFDAVLTVDYDLSETSTLTSVTAFSEMDYVNDFDVFTFSSAVPGVPRGAQNFAEDFSQFTQEFRYDYVGDRMRALLGLFYQSQQLEFVNTTGLENVLIPNLGFLTGVVQTSLDQDLEAYSVFGQISYDLSDRLTVDAGLRFGNETKEADFFNDPISTLGQPLGIPGAPAPGTSIYPFIAPQFAQSGEIDDDALDGALTLSYGVSEDLLFYGSISQGTKSGSFNNVGPVPDPFTVDEEVAQTIEAGAKGSFADGAGYFSAAVFYSEIEGFQDSIFDPNAGVAGGFVTESLDAESSGFEAEGLFRASKSVTLNGSLALLDTTDANTGSRLTRAPELTASLGADVDHALNETFAILGGGLVTHNSGFLHRQTPVGAAPLPANNEISTGEFTLVDLYIGVRHEPTGIVGRFEVKNLTNEQYLAFGFPQPVFQAGLVGAFNPPTTYTLSLRVPFGASAP